MKGGANDPSATWIAVGVGIGIAIGAAIMGMQSRHKRNDEPGDEER
jgi:hypothetical protein